MKSLCRRFLESPRLTNVHAAAALPHKQFDQEKAEERVAALGGGVARIKVGLGPGSFFQDCVKVVSRIYFSWRLTGLPGLSALASCDDPSWCVL